MPPAMSAPAIGSVVCSKNCRRFSMVDEP